MSSPTEFIIVRIILTIVTSEILILTSTSLQWQKETATSNSQKWESLWTHIQNTAARNVLLLGRVKMATENIYMQIYRQRGMVPKVGLSHHNFSYPNHS